MLGAPTDDELHGLLQTVITRLMRLIRDLIVGMTKGEGHVCDFTEVHA